MAQKIIFEDEFSTFRDLRDTKTQFGLSTTWRHQHGPKNPKHGVPFSFFFGEYEYGDNLGIKFFDVPVVIGFNWVLLIILTGNFAHKVFPRSIMFRVLTGSTIMILLDLLIEISAPKLDYWEFANHPVPFSNYLWWFIFSVLFHFIYQSNIKKEYIVSINILIIHFLFFGLLALFL